MPPLNFISTDSSRRLAVFSQIAQVIHDDMKPWEAHLALVTALRQAYGPTPLCYVEVAAHQLPPGQFRLTRVWRGDNSDAVPNHSPWRGATVAVRTGGVIAEVLARGAPTAVRDLNIPADDPVFAELGDYHSLAAAPGGLGHGDNWLMIFDFRPETFDLDFLETLVLRLGLINSALRNLQAARELRRVNGFIDAELTRISDIQRALFPQTPPNAPGLDVAAISETFDRAGGDLYDYAALPDGRWAFLIADASGHGPSAAVVAAMLNTILHAYSPRQYTGPEPPGPAEVLGFANQQLAEKRIDHSFVTAFLAVWDPRRHTFTYGRAGHNPPLLRKVTGEIRELRDVGNIPLAIFPETLYDQCVLELHHGDVVVIYTDGIIDASNAACEEFGEPRLREALRQSSGTAAQILKGLHAAVRAHSSPDHQGDDQTLVVMRVT